MEQWADSVDLNKGKGQNRKLRVAPKGTTPEFLTVSVFLDFRLDPLPFFRGSGRHLPKGSRNTGYAWYQPSLQLS